MPVDFQDIQRQIREMGSQALQQEQKLKDLRELAEAQLHRYSNRLDELQERVELATEINPRLRCALPANEILDANLPLPSSSPAPAVILAADGSQINPSRHDSVTFGVVNVGVFRLLPGSGQAPREIIRSHLLSFDEINPPEGGPIGEEIVALMRDLNEREELAKLACEEQDLHRAVPLLPGQVITLTDGPLELFGESRGSPQFTHLLNQYLHALDTLAEMNVTTAGYVDRPQNDLVIRMLELTMLSIEDLPKAGTPEGRRLGGIADIELFERFLQPGDRSALFKIQSISTKKFSGHRELHFFYLNVGRPDFPALARVEIPAWVAQDPAAVDLLHAALVSQCRQLGARPFPYALHRAHEVAVVSLDEKDQLEAMIANELRRQGLWVGGPSNKQAHKDNSGSRTRYPR
jgi:hypothetical protein